MRKFKNGDIIVSLKKNDFRDIGEVFIAKEVATKSGFSFEYSFEKRKLFILGEKVSSEKLNRIIQNLKD